jgi:phosphate/sulfate permease
MNEKLENIRKISNRLAIALAALVIIICIGAFIAYTYEDIVTAPLAAFAAGIVGGFVGLQRRLKNLSDDDLVLLAQSWVYVCISPLVGGVLAVVLYVLFISTLVSGDLFPKFIPDAVDPCLPEKKSFSDIFNVHGEAVDYAKMMFWSFVAGFSERFVTNIISKFDNDPGKNDKPGT